MDTITDINQTYFWEPSSKKARQFFGDTVDCDSYHAFWIIMNWSSLIIPYNEGKLAILETSLERHEMLENAIEFSPVSYFIFWLGPELFVYHWPQLRGYCPMRCFARREKFDIAWNVLAHDRELFIPPLPEWNKLTTEEKELLFSICSGQTVSNNHNTIEKFINSNFIIFKNNNYVISNFYKTFQYKRKRRKIIYTIKGVRKELITSSDW